MLESIGRIIAQLPLKQNTMAKGQVHHVCPLALFGIHNLYDGTTNEANLVRLSVADHEKIHATLDIPYQRIREFRMSQGYKQWHDLEYHEALKKLQWEYFKNVRKLPYELQVIHAESMKAQVQLLKTVYKYPFDVVMYALEPPHVAFEYYFEQYHLIFKNYAKKKLESRLISK